MHGADYLCHVALFLGILRLRPLILPVGEVLVVVLSLVVVGVEEVLKIVEPYDIAAMLAGLSPEGHGQKDDRKQGVDVFFHASVF